MRANPSVHSFVLDEHLVLFEQRSSALSVLNATAAAYWFALQDNQPHDAFLAALAAASKGHVPSTIEHELATLKQQWCQNGLIVGDQCAEPKLMQPQDEPDFVGWVKSEDAGSADAGRKRHRVDLSLLNTPISVRTDCGEVCAVATDLFAHLSVPQMPNFAAPSFVVEPVDGGWSMGLPGQGCRHARSLAPLLHGQLLLYAYRQMRSFAGFHAGAVSRGDRCVVLPGQAGSGKSSLTVALMYAGYGYCTDELAVIDNTSMRLIPCPINIGLKEGVWSVLAPMVPNLMGRAVWNRDDGQRVRYLPPLDSALQRSDQHKTVTAFVFPRFQAEHRGPASLQGITAGEALSRLTAAGYHLDQSISADWVARMVDWLPQVPSYSLVYSDTASAVAAVAEVLP